MIPFAILRIRAATIFQYKRAALAGMGTQIFWAALKIMIFTALFKQGTGTEPITLSETITFIWLSQALLLMIPWNIDKDIKTQIMNGSIAYELLRPIDLYSLFFLRALAIRLVPMLMRAIPLFTLAYLFFGLQGPVSPLALVSFICSLFAGLFLSTGITTLVMVTLFWTYSGEGIQRLLPGLSVLLSGMVVPLPFFPDWMQPVMNLQPFRGVLDIPSRLYTGVIPTDETLYYLAFQLLWAAFFVLFGRWLLSRAIRQFVVVGG